MKIYTKQGDEGKTHLLNGKKVFKSDYFVDAYGDCDELNCQLGLIKSYFNDHCFNSSLFHLIQEISLIQNDLFVIGSNLSSETNYNDKIDHIEEEDIEYLEDKINYMEEHLPSLKNFILPGGNYLVANFHLARSICRRVERKVSCIISNNDANLELIEKMKIINKYLNRLSDYLFVGARFVAHNEGLNEEYFSGKIDKKNFMNHEKEK